MPTQKQKFDFIAASVPGAQAAQKKWGVPASITLAQAILESEWGESKLATAGNNYFGIKAKLDCGVGRNGGGDYCQFDTAEYVNGKKEIVLAKFRKFKTVADSFDAHGQLLATLPRYRAAMACATDPLHFALLLQQCGYATDPKYPSELAGLIKQFNLTQYDVKEAA